MVTKEGDVKYCNCNIKNIKSLSNFTDLDISALGLFYHYVTERYKIFKLRESGQEKPWTRDSILQSYRFTNVRREHDRASKWLIENISNNKDLSYNERILRTLLFRMYNKVETARLINLNSLEFNWSSEYIDDAYYKLVSSKEDVFTRAYKTVGLKNGLRKIIPSSINYKGHPLMYVMGLAHSLDLDMIIDRTRSQKELFDIIKRIPGVGDFTGYQIFVDMTYINECKYSENEFVACGPGCRCGMDYVFNRSKDISYEERLFWLRDNIDSLFKDIDSNYSSDSLFDNLPEYDRCFNIMSLENCFCEFGKYMLIKDGKHLKPRKYN